jgi:glucokinase
MNALGIHLIRRSARAVLVGNDGAVLSAATAEASDPVAAIVEAATAGDLEAIDADHVFEGARRGDGVSVSVVRDTAKYIGMAAANLVSAIDPEVVVIGGPVASAGDLLIEPVRQEFLKRLPPALADQVRCEMSPLGFDGVAIGAARLIHPER